eukprot:gene53756-73528_t
MVANSSGSLTTAAARLTVLASNPLADPLDSSFAPELTFSPSPTVAALQADGKILLGGQFAYFNQGRPQSGLARLNADGSLGAYSGGDAPPLKECDLTATISIDTLDHTGSFDAYLAEPTDTPRAAIIVIQEIFGVNAGMRRRCDLWAE